MLDAHFPVFGLRLRTPRLELRLPGGEELAALADLAVDGVHPPEVMPFLHPWTDRPPLERARGVAQNHWRALGTWEPADWRLPLVVLDDGLVVGLQELTGRDFAVTRVVGSGSWLGRRHQRRGLGTEMRAAVLHLAFAGLGAEEAVTGAFADNAASLAVSHKLGYRPDGIARYAVRGAPAVEQRLRLSRADWRRHRAVDVEIAGLGEACRAQFGVGS
ncbi:GNAT family N-acetyltransferase [Saccharomonospora iraqiensis]|uniref:GNAT family N-acetyltransferase n=1 Tax=Saccharomonospora iraqiensis TaxID=52698 RepID=UPI00022DF4B7|nr:GNAT family protein [Saccharomonospora iraqiensis]